MSEQIIEVQSSEIKENEPKRVVFKLSTHLKEGTIDDFLGDLRGDLGPENIYRQAPHKSTDEGVRLNLKGGRSLKAMGLLTEARGMSLVGIKWRDDISERKGGGADKGIGLVLEFGYGKTDFEDKTKTEKWNGLARKVFDEYLWDITYYEGGDRIGLFGPSKVVTRTDGSRASNEAGRQFTLNGIKTAVGADGMIFDWNGTKASMNF